MTYYLKYRPQKVNDLDIADVRELLQKTLLSSSFPHAFLFSGPKGTGKTSAARIVAKALNCTDADKKTGEPCGKCATCLAIAKGEHLDVLEMDAASHRGIDDIRYLREAVKLSPVSAARKIYIVDEAHMLTTEASNALLKTLEEPPEHVFFILATTNPEKLIDTIRSRTTLVPFRKATQEELVRSLKRVVNGEKLKLNDESLEIIAKGAQGTLRDAHKLLEQIVGAELKTPEDIRKFLLKGSSGDIQTLISAIEARDIQKIFTQIETAAGAGVSMSDLTQRLVSELHEVLLQKVGIGKDSYSKLTKEDVISLLTEIQIKTTSFSQPFLEQLPLELAILTWIELPPEKKVETPAPSSVSEKNRKVSDVSHKKATSSENGSPKKLNPEKAALTSYADTVEIKGDSVSDSEWHKVLATVKPINSSIEALLRSSKPLGYDGETLTLGVYYRFHKERLEEHVHRSVVENAVQEVFGVPMKVSCVLTEPPTAHVFEARAQNDVVLTESRDTDIINVAKDLFGA